uniref:Uncharacterized protein n=1 Tax=Octopus bimaculoides TaxID=37653 RepID=A0A0L8H2I3_OCTBM
MTHGLLLVCDLLLVWALWLGTPELSNRVTSMMELDYILVCESSIAVWCNFNQVTVGDNNSR